MQKVNDTKDFNNTIARYDSPVFDNYYGFDKNQPADRQIVYCSLYELPENEIGALHFHDTIELGLCRAGVGECHTVHGICDTKTDDVEIFFPYEYHISRSKAGGHSLWNFIQIDLGRLCSETGHSNYSEIIDMIHNEIGISGIIDAERHPMIASLIRRIVTESLADQPGRYMIIMAMLTELLVLNARASVNEKKLGRIVNPKLERLKPALEYIRDNYMKVVKIEDLAQLCCMSISQLRAGFREVTGQTPKDYLIEIRLSGAEKLLVGTDMSVLDIALETGFGDVSNFYRAFRAAKEISPTDYRKKYLKYRNL